MASTITPPMLPLPAPGQTYQDPSFKTTVKRISDAKARGVGWITQEYSTMSPWNADNSRLLLQHQDHFAAYDGEGNFLADAPEFAADCEPRWSRTDPGLGYIRRGNAVLRSGLGGVEVIGDFRQFQEISGLGESDLGFDDRTLALCGDDSTVFLFDVVNPHVVSVMSGVTAANGLYLTPDGRLIIVYTDSKAIALYDRQLNFIRLLAPAASHQDVCRDTNGDEVLIYANSPDPTALNQNGVEKIRLADGQRTALCEFGWKGDGGKMSIACHISCPDSSGFCFVSTYQRPDAPWQPYSGEILKVALDGSGVERICHHRSTMILMPEGGYSYEVEPRVSCSRDGGQICFSSNWGQTEDPNYVDTYMVKL